MAKRNLNRRSAAERAILRIQKNQKQIASTFGGEFARAADFNNRIIAELNRFSAKPLKFEEAFRVDKRTGVIVLKNTQATREAMKRVQKQAPKSFKYIQSRTANKVMAQYNKKLKAYGINPYRIPKTERVEQIVEEANVKAFIQNNLEYIYQDERFAAAVHRTGAENKARLYADELEDMKKWVEEVKAGRAQATNILEPGQAPKR